jgi:hypothetical protein
VCSFGKKCKDKECYDAEWHKAKCPAFCFLVRREHTSEMTTEETCTKVTRKGLICDYLGLLVYHV